MFNYAIFFLSFALLANRFVVNIRSENPNPVVFGYVVFFAVFMVFAPVLQVSSNVFPWPDYYNDDLVSHCVLLVFISILAYEFGYVLFGGDYFSPLANYSLSIKRLKFLIYISFILCPVIAISLGGAEFLFEPRTTEYKMELEEMKAWLVIRTSLMQGIPIVMTLFAVHLYKSQKLSGYFLIFSFVQFIIYCNPIATPRFVYGSAFFAYVMIWLGKEKFSKWIGPLFLSLGFSIIALFPLADIFRGGFDVDFKEVVNVFLNENPVIYKGDFDAFQMMLNGLVYVGDNGHTWFKQLLGALLFPIPRAIWEDKPLPTGQFLAENLNYVFTNLSMPLPGELYIDGGIVFVFIGMAAFAVFSKSIWESLHGSDFRPFVIFFAFYEIFFLRGALLVTFSYITPYFLVYWLCLEKKK